ncbi:glycosyltransferase family 2 protein [Paucihalobacter ruber]|uniref:Glycosyltransferase family 2 protein n=1 Tax=Paucihalobacter ruber TaxID=2567861 RepID=A0A506PQ89_9FLAO|nr:glycosyltransferase family A protein [Paucihalobacter ruber]TPV35749.1 glycosyltransferase family 2 protein [Paucihalobacter ruber]
MLPKKSNLVSIIIPVYNRQELISNAIMSVHEQTYRPIECVIVDDGSTDDSVVIIQELQIKLDSDNFSINLFLQDNAGAPSARNKGIKNAKGEFIQFLDSDDLLYPEKLQIQVSFLKEHIECDGVYGDWHHGTVDNYDLIKGEKWDDMLSQFYGRRVIHTLSFLFRRSMILKIGLWDISLKRNQEIDYFLRGVLAGGNFGYLPRVTGLWREHQGERIVSSSGALSALAFYDKWIEEFNRLGIFSANLKKTTAHFLFWHAMDLNNNQSNDAMHYLHKAYKLYKDFPEWNTPKIKVLRLVIGPKRSINYWYKRAKSSKNQKCRTL